MAAGGPILQHGPLAPYKKKKFFFSMRVTVVKARGEGKREREEGWIEMRGEESKHDEEMQGGESKQRD